MPSTIKAKLEVFKSTVDQGMSYNEMSHADLYYLLFSLNYFAKYCKSLKVYGSI